MSPVALQDATGTQVPFASPVPEAPWQFVEQQSVGYAQLSPRILQLPPGRDAHVPVGQLPEQHSPPAEHVTPSALHGALDPQIEPGTWRPFASAVPWQSREQQSMSYWHASVTAEQVGGFVVHVLVAALQTAEQHWLPSTQDAPPSRQGGGPGGVSHFSVVGLQ